MPRPPAEPITRQVSRDAITRWMSGHPLNDRERSIVESALIINAADQFRLVYPGE